MKKLLVLISFLATFVFSSSVHAAGGTRYAIEDFTIFDGNQKIRIGDEIYCFQIKQGKCLIQDYEGDDEIPLHRLSIQNQPKIDFFLSSLIFNDSSDAKLNACEDGKPIKQVTDRFIWSYGFIVGNNRKEKVPVFVEATHRLIYQGRILNYPVISKRWSGIADGKCHYVIITKNDIDQFIDKIPAISKIIAIEQDLNVSTQFSLQLFSPASEQTYDNNSFSLETRLPADNSTSWPPTTF